ncbi:MAG: DUF6473 family protein [Paracoccus sp. (in: a-proteobacteria)]|uniref:DUF6473 family protein n=1 Tax=Paracoccus sp. TaxID=267 RepID=UPI0026E028C6|nr:DUF6473 family protein [Paracoccus sp. (in: a-proteobacteria)]MDO5621428.1 DUF6473 family protein [Paracoccus sp. (in: a-proteobacteria)]
MQKNPVPDRHSAFYETQDDSLIDYEISTSLGFPARRVTTDNRVPVVAAIGSAHTFGRFAARPWPRLLGDEYGIPTLNIGAGGKPPAFFHQHPAIMAEVNKAQVAVVQCPSARFLIRRAARTVARFRTRYAPQLLELADGWPQPTRLIQTIQRRISASVAEAVLVRTRALYITEMTTLAQAITVPKLLFYFSSTPPEAKQPTTDARGEDQLGGFPGLVDGPTLAAVAAAFDDLLIVQSDTDLPEAMGGGADVTMPSFGRDGMNHYYPSQEMHHQAAEAVAERLHSRFGLPVRPVPRPLTNAQLLPQGLMPLLPAPALRLTAPVTAQIRRLPYATLDGQRDCQISFEAAAEIGKGFASWLMRRGALAPRLIICPPLTWLTLTPFAEERDQPGFTEALDALADMEPDLLDPMLAPYARIMADAARLAEALPALPLTDLRLEGDRLTQHDSAPSGQPAPDAPAPGWLAAHPVSRAYHDLLTRRLWVRG